MKLSKVLELQAAIELMYAAEKDKKHKKEILSRLNLLKSIVQEHNFKQTFVSRVFEHLKKGWKIVRGLIDRLFCKLLSRCPGNPARPA